MTQCHCYSLLLHRVPLSGWWPRVPKENQLSQLHSPIFFPLQDLARPPEKGSHPFPTGRHPIPHVTPTTPRNSVRYLSSFTTTAGSGRRPRKSRCSVLQPLFLHAHVIFCANRQRTGANKLNRNVLEAVKTVFHLAEALESIKRHVQTGMTWVATFESSGRYPNESKIKNVNEGLAIALSALTLDVSHLEGVSSSFPFLEFESQSADDALHH